MKKTSRVALWTAIVGSMVPMLFVLYLMKENNNNGELLDPATGHWNIPYALSVSALIYGLSFITIFGFAYIIGYLWKRDADSSSDGEPLSSYEKVIQEALGKQHDDAKALRELLIATTSTDTAPMAMDYFKSHLDDTGLLASLFDIAAEGEDMGDAPWAAANVIEQFPPDLLLNHRAQLEELAGHPWMYLHGPARRALAKL